MNQVKMELTPRQQCIMAFIEKEISEKGYPPSTREIAKAVNLHSPAAILPHLRALEQYGIIRRDSGKRRAIEVLHRNGHNGDEGVPLPFPLMSPSGEASQPGLRVLGERMYRLPESSPEREGARGGDYILVVGTGDIKISDMLLVHTDGNSFCARCLSVDKNKITVNVNGSNEMNVDTGDVLGRVSAVIRQFQ